MPNQQYDEEEIEMEPKDVLKFGMSKKEVEQLKNDAKKKKRLTKNWKPEGY
jgi:hypothetical protein